MLSNYDIVILIFRFAPYISDAIREPIREKIANCKALSIMYDGATDCSVSEVEIVYCRMLDNGYPKDFFVGLEELEHAHADGVFSAIDKAMTDYVSIHWKEKLVGAGSDGASVNLGVNNSVATRLSNGKPYVLNVHCVAHRLELGILNALKSNQNLITVQDMLKKIYKHYHYSPKALRELRNIAESLEEKVLKPTNLKGTRWVPHISKAMKYLVKDYTVLLAHFEHVSQSKATPEVVGRGTFISNKLKDYRLLQFLFFMDDLLEIISDLSLHFQKDGTTCIDFLDTLETAVLNLLQLRQQPGAKLQGFLDSITVQNNKGLYKNTELKYYSPQFDYTTLQSVIDIVVDRISGRLENPNDPTKSILQAAQIFDTKDWPNDRQQLAVYGTQQLQQLSDHFQVFLDNIGCDRNQLLPEWVHVKAHIGNRLINNVNLPKINTLFVQQPDQYKNILMLIEIVLVLPISSSICERGFSALKRIKSDWRSNLTTDTMNHLLLASIEGPSLDEYNSERAVHLWWTGGQRQRRPQFAPGPNMVEVDEDQLLNFLLNV